jgi:hypothetical protein
VALACGFVRRRADKPLGKLRSRLLYGPGVVEPGLRQAAFRGDPLPASLASLVDKIRVHAYRVTDRDVADALAAGWTESQLFELTVAAAAGSGFQRLDLVDRLLEASPGELR